MKKLIADLEKEGMIIQDYYADFDSNTVPISGALGALVSWSNTWYCSITETHFYYFKIKNIFSYKGIKHETIQKIQLKDISQIIWKPKLYGYGGFTIEYSAGKLSGIFSNQFGRENFEKILSFMTNVCKIPCNAK